MFSLLGRAFLFIRYRDFQKVRKVLADEYEDSYTQAELLALEADGFVIRASSSSNIYTGL